MAETLSRVLAGSGKNQICIRVPLQRYRRSFVLNYPFRGCIRETEIFRSLLEPKPKAQSLIA